MRARTREMTDDPIVIRIIDQLQVCDKTEKELELFLGVSNGTVNSWKFKNVKTYTKWIDQISEFLDTPKDYLLEGARDYNGEKITPSEMKVLELYRQMGNKQQVTLMSLMDIMVESTRYGLEDKS